ncbi:Arylacetonitrilase [Fusarium oxysporum f. sp. albedinis]|nr:Arylacetonitrilase [Fusarium oxysporum f. sp. albedinis]
MSTVNIIKQYFHARNVPVSEERTRRLIALAYQTAKGKGALPKAVFMQILPLNQLRYWMLLTIEVQLDPSHLRPEAPSHAISIASLGSGCCFSKFMPFLFTSLNTTNSTTMKHQVVIATFLAAFNNAAAKQLAPVKLETWCITYVSTYLVPLQASSNLTEIGEATKYSSLAPTLDVTAADNASSVTTQISTEDTSSSAFETQLVDDQSTEPQPGTESTDGTTIVPTSSVEAELTSSSNTASASSIGTEPAGRSIIFLISLTENDKRDLSRRATGGFVGNENPGVCTFAAVFTLSDDQLLEDGIPIYYAGEEFKELSGQGQAPSDAVTKTFLSSGGGLQFTNAKLPGGQAGFCQDSSGKVYITFSSGPPGCIPVDLSVYEVEQCQNGRLLGLDTSRTSSSDLTEPTQDVTSTGEAPGQSQTLSASSADSTSVEAFTTSSSSTTGSTDTATVPFGTMTSSSPGLSITTTVSPLSSSFDSSGSSATDNSGVEEGQSSSVSEEGFPETASTSDAASSDVTSDTVTDGDGSTTSQNISDETPMWTDSSETATSSDMSTEPGASASTKDVPQTSTTGDITSEILSTTMDASTTKPTTVPTINACVSGITSPDGESPLNVRDEECSDLNVVTVSPATV